MKTILISLILFVLIVVGCNQNSADSSQTNGTGSQTPAVKENEKPVADSEIAIVEMDNPAAYGSFSIELYSNIAPEMVARFKELSKEGFYDGVLFHRVDQNLGIIQAGDPKSKDDDPTNDGTGSSDLPNVPAEFSDIPFDTGIVGAARRGNDVNSQNSQWFVMTKRQPAFDKQYTVFGKVIEGMENVRVIGAADADNTRPKGDIRIKTIKIVPKGEAK